MRKKIVTMAMALFMALTMLCACGKNGTDEKNMTNEGKITEADGKGGKQDEKITFKIAVLLNPLNKEEDFNKKEIFMKASAATGVEIEWIPIAESDAEDKVNIMLASDLPDAFYGLISENQIVANMESFIDLTKDDMLKQHAPHVVADYEKLRNGLDILTWPDGSIRSLITGPQTSYENDGEGIMFINKKWLDRVGKDVPTNIDEFYDVLKAFHDQDANGNGDPSDEIPFEPCQADWCSKIMNLANPWGIAGTDFTDETAYKMVENGKVKGTVNTDEFRKFIEYAHKLSDENLMDKELFTETFEQYHAKLGEGVVGCMYTWVPQESEFGDEFVPVPILDDGNGNYAKTGSQDKFSANRTGFCITKECKNPEKLLEWWDYMSSSTELKFISRFGPKGEAWDIQEDGTVYEKMPENLTDDFTYENYKYTCGMVGNSTYITKDEKPKVLKEENYSGWYRIDTVSKVHDYCLPVDRQLPIRFVAPEKISERNFLETELFNYINSFVATSVIEGIDDEAWDTHLKQLEAVQYDKWLQWYQDYLDKKF